MDAPGEIVHLARAPRVRARTVLAAGSLSIVSVLTSNSCPSGGEPAGPVCSPSRCTPIDKHRAWLAGGEVRGLVAQRDSVAQSKQRYHLARLERGERCRTS